MNNPEADDELTILCVGEIILGELSLASPVSWCFAESAEGTLVSESEHTSHDNGSEVDTEEAGGANTSTDSAEGNSGSAAEAAHVDTDEKEEETVEEEDSGPLRSLLKAVCVTVFSKALLDFGSFLNISPESVLSEISASPAAVVSTTKGIGKSCKDKGNESARGARNIVDDEIVRVTRSILPDSD